VKYKENYRWDEGHCFGFSAQSGDEVMRQHDYTILQIYDHSNIVCVQNEILDEIPFISRDIPIDTLYRVQYIHNFTRFNALPWNDSVNYWLELTDKEQLKNEIIFYFSTINHRSNFENKTKVHGVDFLCDISK